jgi:broad specificity phosphatase PhoE
MTRKLVLIRHAITTAPKNTLLGRNDLPLSKEGVENCQLLKNSLKIQNTRVKYIVSDLIRAKQTAEILLPSAEFTVDPKINEIDFGRWSGLSIDEISRDYPDLMKKWADDPMKFSFPGGESVEDFISRIREFITIYVSGSQDHLVLVCHGGVIRFIICALLNIDFRHHLGFEIHRPSLNVIDHDGNYGVLSGLNLTQFEFK